jgi:hypothetical protein
MAMPKDQMRERELERRRENEEKDLEVERQTGPRPLEGFSGAHTSWTGEQDDAPAGEEHGDDERKSRERSERQVEAVPREASGEEE